VNPDDTLHEALTLMIENRVSALPVIDGRRHTVGVLSSSDVLELAQELGSELDTLNEVEGLIHHLLTEKLSESGLQTQKVQELMTDNVISVTTEDTLVHAAAEMVRSRVHRLMVVDNEKRLLGIVSTMDILAAFADGAPG
jgi:CBS domain-containing protein